MILGIICIAIYYAMAQKGLDDKDLVNKYESLTISKGVYECETLYNWMDKTDCIKDVFNRLTAGRMPDKNHPCIEWYKSPDEMVCMIKSDS